MRYSDRFLLRELVKRDLQGRYAGSVLGVLWSFVQPLWTLVLFSFVFSTVMKISVLGERTDSFAVFLFCGLLPWMAVSEGVQRCTTAITDNAQLVTKLRFPSEVLLVAIVLAALVHEAIAASVFVVLLLFSGDLAWSGLPLLLLAVPLQAALVLGLGLLLASAHVYFRDTAQFVSLALNGWFYLTPIVYPLALVPARYRAYLEANPLTALVGLYRAAFLGGEMMVPGLAGLVVVTLVVLSVGFAAFRRLRPGFADEI